MLESSLKLVIGRRIKGTPPPGNHSKSKHPGPNRFKWKLFPETFDPNWDTRHLLFYICSFWVESSFYQVPLLWKGRGQHAAIKMEWWGRRCLEIAAVIGRRRPWRLSCSGSHWSEQVYSTCVQRLYYSINVQEFNWSKQHVCCATQVCVGSVNLYSSV